MAKRKKYSLILEDADVIGVEVDGKRYADASEITNELDQSRVRHMVDSLYAAEFEAAEPRMDKTSKVIQYVFMGIAALMLIILVISSLIIGSRVIKEETAEGRVVDMVLRKVGEGSSYYYPTIAFNLPDGTIQRVQLTEGSWPPAYVIGQPVAVRYDPQQPAATARIQTLGSSLLMWTLPMIMAVLSAAFVGASIFVRWMMQPEPAKPSVEQELYKNA